MNKILKTLKKYKNIIYFIIFLFIFLLLIKIYNKNRYELFSNNEPSILMVIAHYNEDLTFLDSEPFSKYNQKIYTKGNNKPKCKSCNNIENLPNIGMNIHTYFKYIIDNYDNLPDFVIFLPGSCLDPLSGKRDKTYNTIAKFEETKNSVFYVVKSDKNILNYEYNFQIDDYNISNSDNKKLNNISKLKLSDTRPFGKWYNKYFSDIDIKNINLHGIFVVSKEQIRNRNKSSYEELIKQLDETNTEVAHYFERVTLALFHPIPDNCLYF